jgi:hypothetical protein
MREITVKVSEDEYKKLTEAREILARKGMESLPFKPQSQISDFALGAIVAIGALLIIRELTK